MKKIKKISPAIKAYSSLQPLRNAAGFSYGVAIIFLLLLIPLAAPAANTFVGVGTTSPQVALDITSTTSGFLPPRMTTTQRIAISSPPAGSVVFDTTAGTLYVYTGLAWVGSISQWLTSGSNIYYNSGNVGIGTTSPSSILEIKSSAWNAGVTLNIGNTNSGGTSDISFNNDWQTFTVGLNGSGGIIGTSNFAYLNNKATGPMGFFTSNIERMRIDAAGNVGIGTTSPSHPFHVYNATSAAIYGEADGGAYGVVGYSGGYQGSLGRNDGFAFVGIGAVWASGASYFNQSDGRLKENIQPLASSVENLLKLRPVTYQWKPGTVSHQLHGSKPQIGFIAQEVEKIYPDAVIFNANPGESKLKDGKPSLDSLIKGNYGVAYVYLIPVIIKGIQEIWGELQSLTARVDAIHGHFQAKEATLEKLQARLVLVQQQNTSLKDYLCQKDPQANYCVSAGKAE